VRGAPAADRGERWGREPATGRGSGLPPGGSSLPRPPAARAAQAAAVLVAEGLRALRRRPKGTCRGGGSPRKGTAEGLRGGSFRGSRRGKGNWRPARGTLIPEGGTAGPRAGGPGGAPGDRARRRGVAGMAGAGRGPSRSAFGATAESGRVARASSQLLAGFMEGGPGDGSSSLDPYSRGWRVRRSGARKIVDPCGTWTPLQPLSEIC
jgi:hypothetical protein